MAEQILPEMQDISRQRDLAKLLLQKGMTDNLQGQMVSGRYVGASPIQGIANIYSAYKGGKMLRDADQKQIELADMLRKQTMQDVQAYGKAISGTPEQTVYGAGMEGPTMDVTPAVAPDYSKALSTLMGSRSPQSQALGNMLLADQMKTQKVGEGETLLRPNFQGGFTTVGQGAEKFRAPIQVDTGNTIEFRDPKDPTKVLQVIPKTQMPNAGQIVQEEGGTFLVDTRTGQARPVMGQDGQQLVGGKPLTESQSKASAFKSQMTSANNVVNKLESEGFDPTSLATQSSIKLAGGSANPLVPVKAQQYKQAQNQWSEAFLRFKTGAAATEPEVILNNRTFFPVFGDKPDQIAQKAAMREQAERDIGIAAGRGANLGAKPTGQLPKQNMQPTPSANAPRAMLNNQPIVVKNGKWVYERTGKAVE
jgi:hypothetical protein